MLRTLAEAMVLALCLFLGSWTILHYGDLLFFNQGATAKGRLAKDLDSLQVDCGDVVASDRSVRYKIDGEHRLVLLCPTRLFPIRQRKVITKPTAAMVQAVEPKHRGLLDQTTH